MRKIWPWSIGAPVVDEHNELEEEMSPDPKRETDVYDLQRGQRDTTANNSRVSRPESRK